MQSHPWDRRSWWGVGCSPGDPPHRELSCRVGKRLHSTECNRATLGESRGNCSVPCEDVSLCARLGPVSIFLLHHPWWLLTSGRSWRGHSRHRRSTPAASLPDPPPESHKPSAVNSHTNTQGSREPGGELAGWPPRGRGRGGSVHCDDGSCPHSGTAVQAQPTTGSSGGLWAGSRPAGPGEHRPHPWDPVAGPGLHLSSDLAVPAVTTVHQVFQVLDVPGFCVLACFVLFYISNMSG